MCARRCVLDGRPEAVNNVWQEQFNTNIDLRRKSLLIDRQLERGAFLGVFKFIYYR